MGAEFVEADWGLPRQKPLKVAKQAKSKARMPVVRRCVPVLRTSMAFGRSKPQISFGFPLFVLRYAVRIFSTQEKLCA